MIWHRLKELWAGFGVTAAQFNAEKTLAKPSAAETFGRRAAVEDDATLSAESPEFQQASQEDKMNTVNTSGLTNTQVSGPTRNKRISVYNIRVTMQFPVDDEDETQSWRQARKDIEEYAKAKGAINVETSGSYGSTKIVVPK